MKKSNFYFKFVIFLFLALFTFVSCSDDSSNYRRNEITLGVDLNSRLSKSLTANYGTLIPGDYYWYYKTTVTDYEGNPSVVDEQKIWTEDSSKGLAGGQKFSIGKWTLELWAYKDGGNGPTTSTGLSYYGKAEFRVTKDRVDGNVTTTSNFTNDDGTDGYMVYVPMMYVDKDNNDQNIEFTGEQGTINYAYSSITTLEVSPEKDYDAKYKFWKITTITNIEEPDNPLWVSNETKTDETTTIDNVSYTSFSSLPGTYSITTLYDSLGVYYKVTDTVDIHSNKTVTVKGDFENRERKTFRVYFHDGKLLNSSNEVSVSSTNAFSGNINNINAVYKEKEGKDFFHGVETMPLISNPSLTTDVPYIDYQFEDEIVLPYTKNTTDSSFRDGYGFWGWYTTDSAWSITDECLTTEANKIRTSGTHQVIFVSLTNAYANNEKPELNNLAEFDFANSYGLYVSSFDSNVNELYAGPWKSSDFVYEIHLFARWQELAKTVGVRTSPSNNITLYDTMYGKFNQDGYVHLTTVEGMDRVQGWKEFKNLKFYKKVSDGTIITGTLPESTPQVEYIEYFIDGWYTNETGDGDGDILVITNDGTFARYNPDNTGLINFINEDGTWKYQNKDDIQFFAHWSTRTILK